ncbi:MAG: hypothetical protein ACRELG_22885, partial [Gemmataceae bacterium]
RYVMKRVLMLVVSVMLIGSTARAQYMPSGMPSYGNQSAMSYINLLQPNVNPAVSYLGIVQPQLQGQASLQQLQNQINMTRMMPGGVAPPRNGGVTDTGYAPARFMSYQQYYNTIYNSRGQNNQRQFNPRIGFAGGR